VSEVCKLPAISIRHALDLARFSDISSTGAECLMKKKDGGGEDGV
jgi:hypothetical protein